MKRPSLSALIFTLILPLSACEATLPAVFQTPMSGSQSPGGPANTCLFSPSAYAFRIQCQITQDFHLRFKTQNRFLDLRQNVPSVQFFNAKDERVFDTNTGDKLSFRQNADLVVDYTSLAFPRSISDERFRQSETIRLQAQIRGFKPVLKTIAVTKSENRLTVIPELVVELEAQ